MNKKELVKSASDIIEFMNKEENKKRPWMYYAFSNGGCFLYDALRIEMRKRTDPATLSVAKRLCGAVFDSSPADVTVSAASKAVTAPNM